MTELISSRCLKVFRRRVYNIPLGRCVVGSVVEDIREGEHERGIETRCHRANHQMVWNTHGIVETIEASRQIDVLFAAWHLIEKHQELPRELHKVLVDPEKAHDSEPDSVPSQEVSRCMRKHDVPEK